MTDESEKRFHAIMDKLFQAPSKSKSKEPTTDSTSLSGVQLSRGNMLAVLDPKSRVGVVHELCNPSSGTVQAPLCRPWDRGDLLKRLATFKSMTWFAKPEVVNAVNCARRGWVNVDMDIITCESCGARLLFSTPTSWAQHQVVKAALVFSLKLNNGHKLHCPWVDNACDETLAQFPPTPVADLVDNYKKRCNALSQLVALPVISSLAIDYMRNPQLEHFLSGCSTVGYGNKSSDASITEYLGNECEALFSILYYQAQKLISVCGWESRSLPYIVDCKDLEDQSTRDGNLSNPSQVVSNGQTPSINVFSSGTAEKMERNEGVQYDPSSVVLDCRLCGASVGLWAFCTTPRPLEFIRLIGCSEVNDDENINDHQTYDLNNNGEGTSGVHVSSYENNVESRERILCNATTGATSSNGMLLNLTIAGGPPPAEQNFRPTISFPVVGQNLRARFSSEFESMDDGDLCFKADKEHSFTSIDLLPCLRSDISEPVEAVRDDSDGHMSLEEADITGNEIPGTSKPDSTMGNPLENVARVILGASTVAKLSENATNVETVEPTAGDLCSSRVGSTSITTLDGQVSTGYGETTLNGASLTVVAVNGHLQQNKGTVTICSKQGQDCGVQATLQPVNNNSSPGCLGKDLKQLPVAKAMEFDPIKQHRHFCPWIASSVNSVPGWKQTLDALHRQEEFSCPLSPNTRSSSLIEVDDPIGSVKRLFTPPPAKRKKLSHGSS